MGKPLNWILIISCLLNVVQLIFPNNGGTHFMGKIMLNSIVYSGVPDVKPYISCYVVGNVPFADTWLSLTPNGSPLTPQENQFYLILTAGEYYNHLVRYSVVDTAYVEISGGSAIQVDTMPTASVDLVGTVYQFIGTTTGSYVHGWFYECVENSGVYSWKQVQIQPNLTVANEAALIVPGTFTDPFIGMLVVTRDTNIIYLLSGADPTVATNWKKAGTSVDAQFSTTSENPLQNKVLTEAIGDLTDLDTTATNLVGAVNETLEKCGTSISQTDFDALSQEEKDNGTAWYIYDDSGLTPSLANTGFTPVGTVISVMGTTAPNHYLPCNGQVVNISNYPELAHYFEVQFGTKNYFGGNGTTTFGIPDLRGESAITVSSTNTSALYCIATKNIYIDVKSQYSTDEMVVGTWIDGKPIYQKTYQVTVGSNIVVLTVDMDIEQIIDIKRNLTARSNSEMNAFDASYGSWNTWYKADTKEIRQENIPSWALNNTCYLTIQYTKTTD